MKTIIVMPAYNAEATLEKTIADIPFDHIHEIVLVDDASRDTTVATAQAIVDAHPLLTLSLEEYEQGEGKILFTIVKHEKNKGYGGNQKNCYNVALAHGADIVVMLHPDYQYDPKIIKYFVAFIRDHYFDVMLGSRIRSRAEALAGGMPPYKYYANRALSFMENIATGRVLTDWHTGMRAYTKEVLESIGYEQFSDDFIFDTQVLFAVAERGYAVGDIPVPVRYFKEASSINFSRSSRYGILTVWETIKFLYRKTKQFSTYVVSGVLAVATNILVYALLLNYAHVHYLLSAFIGFCAGGVVSFSLQKYWVFKRSSNQTLSVEIPLYILIAVVNAAINSGLLYVFVDHFAIHKLYANILSNSIVAIWGFFVFKNIAFKERRVVMVK